MRKPLCTLCILFALPFAISAQPLSGHVAHYLLDNTLTDKSGNGYNGSLTSTTATTDRFGVANKATAFVAGSSTGQLPGSLQTRIQNSFSVSCWFKTTLNASNSTQWYGGNAMIDAEVCGGTSDWGIAIINGGKLCFGIGNPDLTIISTLNYNDGNWHFLTANRDQTAATIALFVDGVQEAATGGTSTSALTAPTFIGLGNNPCVATAKYTGSLDELIVYDRTLNSTETQNLYNFSVSATLPLDWVAFTGNVHDNTAKFNWEVANIVNNDHFDIEYSTDGVHFGKAGTVAAHNNLLKYSFSLDNLPKANYYFRIKQVDLDGRYSFSKTIALTMHAAASSIHLLGNPVSNQLIISNPNQELLQQLIVTDATGRRVINKQFSTSTTVMKTDITSLKPGFYLVSMVTRNALVALSFIKQ